MTRLHRAAYGRETEDPDCVGEEEAAALLGAAPWRRLVAIGDSVAAGVREAADGYRDLDGISRVAEVLRKSGGSSFVFRNLGQRDLRLAEIRKSQLARALQLRPDLVIVAGGGNDALGRSYDEDQLASELTLLVAPLVSQGAQLVTVGLFDLARSGLVPEHYATAMARRFDGLDALTARIAIEHGGVHVDNHHHPLAAFPGIFASDRIHANARGHAIAAANLTRTLAELLG